MRAAKYIKTLVYIHGPDPHVGGKAQRFMACVKIGRTHGRRSGGECAFASTPRKALKIALRQVAESIGKRKGAFNWRGTR